MTTDRILGSAQQCYWKTRRQALKYTMLDGELYRRTVDGLLLKCLGAEQGHVAMGEVREGMCDAHQSVQKMRWTIRRVGLYWPTMVDDCIRYKKCCELCQRLGDIQAAPVSMLHPIVKP
jgi:hypothetical protein